MSTFCRASWIKNSIAALMKKGSKKKKKGFDENKDEEHIVSMIVSLFRYLTASTLDRLISKFTERDYEKVDRIIELHEKYYNAVKETDKKFQNQELELSEEEIYLEKLDAGLFTLQLTDLVIAFACNYTPLDGKNTGIKERLQEVLHVRNKSVNEIKVILDEYLTSKQVGKIEDKEAMQIEEKEKSCNFKTFKLVTFHVQFASKNIL